MVDKNAHAQSTIDKILRYGISAWYQCSARFYANRTLDLQYIIFDYLTEKGLPLQYLRINFDATFTISSLDIMVCKSSNKFIIFSHQVWLLKSVNFILNHCV